MLKNWILINSIPRGFLKRSFNSLSLKLPFLILSFDCFFFCPLNIFSCFFSWTPHSNESSFVKSLYIHAERAFWVFQRKYRIAKRAFQFFGQYRGTPYGLYLKKKNEQDVVLTSSISLFKSYTKKKPYYE